MATFPLICNSNLYVHKDLEICKVQSFFENFESVADLQISLHSSSSFFVSVRIDDFIIKLSFSDTNILWPISVCFYDHHQISKKMILKECRNVIVHQKCKFDDTLIMLVGIKDEKEQSTAEKKSDIAPEMQKVNVKFIDWSLNSSGQDTRKILQNFARMGVIKMYFDKIRELHQHSWFNQDKGSKMFSDHVSTEGTRWSIDSPLLFSIAATGLLDLFRINITHSAPFYRFRLNLSNRVIIAWKNPLCLPLQTCSTTDNKVYYCGLDDNTISHMNKVPVSSVNHPVSILSVQQYSDISNLPLASQGSETAFVKSLVILHHQGKLNFSELMSRFNSIQHLVIRYSTIDATSLMFPTQLCQTIKHLVMVACDIAEVPEAVGSLTRLTLINISWNSIRTLPWSLGNLRNLKTFLHDGCPIEFPPSNVLKRSAQDVVKYLRALQHDDESVPYNEGRLIVVGQEGVGKSTLINAMQRKNWTNEVIKPPDKTDSIVEIKDLLLKDKRFLVYKFAGNLEEYQNTHPLFASSQFLHLVVFDMSNFVLGKEPRSVNLWLEMIAAQNINTYAMIVGTKADHQRITTEIQIIIRKKIVELIQIYRVHHREYFDNCIICNDKLLPTELKEIIQASTLTDVGASEGSIPHILGYFEVSSVTKYPPAMLSLKNKNLESLKSAIASSNDLVTNLECQIPKAWLSFYKKVSGNEIMSIVHFSDICNVALKSGVRSDMVESMLRFFHSQRNLLWYEDIPEMREVIITDPQWLADQLRAMIFHRPPVNAVCTGILHTSSLREVWPNLTEESRHKLIALFRSVGVCFRLSDDKEMLPCNLPIGWPDHFMWPSAPGQDENQTSILFTFTFLPPNFFSKLIVEVDKKRDSFPRNVEPLYTRFNILYVINEQKKCDLHHDESECDIFSHRVHYELIPHSSALKVSIRGPSPCCIVSDVCSTIDGVQLNSGISFQKHLVCPVCEMYKIPGFSTFPFPSSKHETTCSKRHDVGSVNDILQGKYSSAAVPRTDDTDTLNDFQCPKLFVVLPINTCSSSLKDRFVYSYLKDGYAVHLLCECPDQWHFVDSPGFRIAKPIEFLEKYGNHLCTVMKAIGKLGTPLGAAAVAEPLCKTGAAVASGASSIAKELESVLYNAIAHCLEMNPASYQDLGDIWMPSGLQRSELANFLETAVRGRGFGPLVLTYVDKSSEWLWLCEEHNRRFTVVNK